MPGEALWTGTPAERMFRDTATTDEGWSRFHENFQFARFRALHTALGKPEPPPMREEWRPFAPPHWRGLLERIGWLVSGLIVGWIVRVLISQ
jgi:hypothetical protein